MGKDLMELEPTPVVGIKAKEGGVFIGVLVDGPRQVEGKRGVYNVWGFKVEDTDCPVQLKQDGEYKDVGKVAPGTLVNVFAPTALNRGLLKADKGMRLKITYKGLKKPLKGREFHNFSLVAL